MRTAYGKSFLFLFIFVLLCSFSLSVSRDTLTPNQLLSGDETLVSTHGTFSLGFFSPTSSENNRYIGIWYTTKRIPGQRVIIWVGNRQNPVSGPTAVLMLTSNGSLLVTDGNSKVFWSSPSMVAVGKPVAQLLDAGNFVVRDSHEITDSNSFAWQSFDHPTDTLLPGMKLGWNLTSGLNRNLTAWSSSTDPSPGNYTLALDLRGDPQLILWNGHILQQRTGPWTGLHFIWLSSQSPQTLTYTDALVYRFVNNKEEVYFSTGVVNKSTITRLVVSPQGVAERYIWLDKSRVWDRLWYSPSGPCDGYAACGPYGLCDPNGYPMCSCLQGFEPKSPANWALRYASDGCVRKTKLDCRNGTDGFVTVPQTLLPDTVNATVNRTMSLDECQAACLRNCSCTGFSSADIRGSGSGCIIWSMDLMDIASSSDGGQDFYLRLAAEDIGLISSQSHKSGDAALAVSLSVVLGVISLLVSVACYAWRKLKWTRGNAFVKEDDMEMPLFEFVEIEAATNNFSNENKLGEGGFGSVYKGKMREGQEIAVKRLSKTSLQGLDELKTEVVLVAKLQHRNLVRLLGCCLEGDERILIYEFMPNKSLDTFLFDEQKVALLDWRMRYQIILGIARGLLYLHQDSRFRIIHRDLKAGNILLDKDMIPKISDFGLARLFGEDETETKTRRVVGTYGYMPPEYALNGIFSVKSDVFSFGVLVLEIISGRRNKGVYLSAAEEYLLGKAWTLWKEGNILQLIDTSLDASVFMTGILRCMKVGLLCVQEQPEDRPIMSSVVLMLCSDHAFLPEPKQPGFMARVSPTGSPSPVKENSSINDLTLTMSLDR
ncbi:receptor-like serine/threonine-protein kinase SD1-8 isoform X2 [Asparagus officinalis]|uniref:receptor-like serine/threonine-protein kinase SD1-8 isoform X2 n=1 Tax=Asparagus officinalis TaxID=4686 RepID=UPI00098E2837|nr:receptor-like serine/threonine-protein kinase SD1-8 isoform X2 [Asparagus officinalis]